MSRQAGSLSSPLPLIQSPSLPPLSSVPSLLSFPVSLHSPYLSPPSPPPFPFSLPSSPFPLLHSLLPSLSPSSTPHPSSFFSPPLLQDSTVHQQTVVRRARLLSKKASQLIQLTCRAYPESKVYSQSLEKAASVMEAARGIISWLDRWMQHCGVLHKLFACTVEPLYKGHCG